MIFRTARIADIPAIQLVRRSVKENILSNPSLVTDEDVKNYITKRGKGWVCEVNGLVAGFSIADLQNNNIWALFVHPDYERKGIGIKLHQLMLDWYFSLTNKLVWLSTDADSRAASFYRKAGWKEAGKYGIREIKFTMSAIEWKEISEKKQNEVL